MDPITRSRVEGRITPPPGGRRTMASRYRRRRTVVAAVAALAIGAGAAGIAAALAGAPQLPAGATGVTGSTQFDITGFIQSATLEDVGDLHTSAANHLGGHLVVNGQDIVIPNETIVILPANALTWAELFEQAPEPYHANGQTGLALNDSPPPITTYEVHVVGNRVVSGGKDRMIAGLVNISQQDLNQGAGYISFIDYNVGGQPELRVGGTIGDVNCKMDPSNTEAGGPACSGARVKINDPDGRFTKGGPNADPRFTVDPENPTIASGTGFPMCIPRVDVDPVDSFLNHNAPIGAVTDDPLCPLNNRLKKATWDAVNHVYVESGNNLGLAPNTPGGFDTTTNLVVGGAVNGYVMDPTKQIPMEVGDYVTFAGTLMHNGANPTAAGPGSVYVSAHTIINNFGAYTAPGIDPAYVSIEVSLIGTGGLTVFGLGEAAVRTRFEGMSTDPTRVVKVTGVDMNPLDGSTTDREFGMLYPDPGPPNGAVAGRWRMRPPCTVTAGSIAGLAGDPRLCTKSPTGNYLPPPREVRATILPGIFTVPGTTGGSAANGITYGQYHAPVDELIFPENTPGTPIVPNNFETIDFLALGGYTSSTGEVGHQLDPWPGLVRPAGIVCPSVTNVTAGGPYANLPVNSTSVQLAGTADPAITQPVSYSWTVTDTAATPTPYTSKLTNGTTLTPTLNTNGIPASTNLVFSLTVTNLCGSVTVSTTGSTAAAVTSPPNVVATGSSGQITLNGALKITASTTSGNVTQFKVVQKSPVPNASNTATGLGTAVGTTSATFNLTPPLTGTYTFGVTALTAANVASPEALVTVTVVPPTTMTFTQAEYRTGKQRLILTVNYPANVTSIQLQPYVTNTGTTFDPAILGTSFTLAGGVATITLVGAPPPQCANLTGSYATPCTKGPLKVIGFGTLNGVPNLAVAAGGPQALLTIRT